MIPRVAAIVVLLVVVAPARGEDESSPAPPVAKPVLTVQTGQGGVVSAVAFSPDGAHVLTGGWDQTARLFEAATGREVRRFAGHGDAVTSVAFSPDGAFVLTGARDRRARLWETATGRARGAFAGHDHWVTSVAFSSDGSRVLTGSTDKTARLWDTHTAREVQRFEGHGAPIRSCAFAPGDAQVLTGSDDKTARLWDVATGREVQRFEGHDATVTSVALSPDGAHVVTGSIDKTVRLWDRATSREVRTLAKHSMGVSCVAVSPDGAAIVAGSGDGVRLCETASGREMRSFRGHEMPVTAVAFSPDGAHVLAGAFEPTVKLWETATGRAVRTFSGLGTSTVSVAFAPDGRHVVVGSTDQMARLWEIATGRMVRRFAGHAASVLSVAFSPDGQHVLTGSIDKSARLWAAATGREVRRFDGHTGWVTSVAFAPDGRRILTGSGDRSARLWDVSTGREMKAYLGHRTGVLAVAFSPDGARVLTGSGDKTARLWNTTTGDLVRSFEGHRGLIGSVAFSPDGARVLTGCSDQTARLWETETGRVVHTLRHDGMAVFEVAFSPDGVHMLTSSGHRMARLWRVDTGREVRRFQRDGTPIHRVAFSPSGAQLLTSSLGPTAGFWDTATGELLCEQMSFADGSWVVFDAAGRYDASSGGDVRGVHWVIGMEVIDLTQLKERAYDPGLLAKHLGRTREPLLEVAQFDGVDLFPAVDVMPPAAGEPLRVRLTNRGGGIGRVRVLVNGKELEADARGAGFDDAAPEAVLAVDLRTHPAVKPGERNAIEVVAWNAAGYLSSPRGIVLDWDAPGEPASDPVQLWAIVCGVRDYRGTTLDLKWADKDAEDFAQAVRVSAGAFFGAKHVDVQVLTTSDKEGVRRPTRANLESAFAAVERAKPKDILVVYMAGHGVSRAGPRGDFHYLLADAATADLTDPAVRRQVSLSSLELTELIKRVPATKQVLILDTCASARVIETLTESREVPGSQRRALERVKDRTGMFVLAGCAADRVSYEASRYGQGLLTYSLLLGMRGAALRDDLFVDVQKLFAFAEEHVPLFAKDVGGVQRPVPAIPRGGSTFDMGKVSPELQKSIPLQTVKPIFVRASFQDLRRQRDHLKLQRATHAVLRDETAKRGNASLVFVDVSEMPAAYELTGRYTIRKEAVTVKVIVWQGEREAASFEVQGTSGDVGALARDIVHEAQKHVR